MRDDCDWYDDWEGYDIEDSVKAHAPQVLIAGSCGGGLYNVTFKDAFGQKWRQRNTDDDEGSLWDGPTGIARVDVERVRALREQHEPVDPNKVVDLFWGLAWGAEIARRALGGEFDPDRHDPRLGGAPNIGLKVPKIGAVYVDATKRGALASGVDVYFGSKDWLIPWDVVIATADGRPAPDVGLELGDGD